MCSSFFFKDYPVKVQFSIYFKILPDQIDASPGSLGRTGPTGHEICGAEILRSRPDPRPAEDQWLFLVRLKGGRWHIIPQLAVYTTYILPSGGLYNPYHLLGEPETTIEKSVPLFELESQRNIHEKQGFIHT